MSDMSNAHTAADLTDTQTAWLAANGIEAAKVTLGRRFSRVAPPAGYESLYVFVHDNSAEIGLYGTRTGAGDHVSRHEHFWNCRDLRAALADLRSLGTVGPL